MRILNSLSIRNLKLNKKRTIVTIIGIILSTSLMVGIGLLFSTFQDYMIREVKSETGSYHIELNDVSKEQLNIVKKEKGINYFYERKIGFSKINSENEYKPYLYISAVNEKYFDELELIEGSFPKNDREIVISEHISSNGGVNFKVGDTITLEYGKRMYMGEEVKTNSSYLEGENLTIEGSLEYKIVGIVKRSRYEDYSASGYSVFTINNDNNNDDNVKLFITFDKEKKIIKKAKDLAQKISYDEDLINYNSSLLALYGESIYGNIMQSMMGLLMIMLSLVSVGCIIVIYNSFAISVMERKRQFGLLASIGTTKKNISYMVLFEAVITGIIGIALGILGAYMGIGVVVVILNKLLKGALQYELVLTTRMIFIVIPVIFMMITILISAIIPAIRASRVPPIEAIRQNDDIKINKKKIKTRKYVRKLFGVEGEIALKNIKRNKKKYRITTISLFISIVLFISFSAYMKYVISTTDNMMGTYSYDINVTIMGNYENDSELNKNINELLSSSDTKDYVRYGYTSIPIKKEQKYTKEYLEYMKSQYNSNDDYDYIEVIVLENEDYEKYKSDIGLTDDKVIILNKFKGVSYMDGKRTNYDINVLDDEKIVLSICDYDDEDNIYCNKKVNNIFVTDKPYKLMDEVLHNEGYKLIMNKRMYDTIIEDEIYFTTINIVSDNYSNLDKIGEKLEKGNVNYFNMTENMKMENNITMAIEILMYGFITLVTLIGVTSVFNTISTSITLRRREFAVLRSIGLTKRGFNKMLFFESLFFGIKSLILALPVSFGVILLIHKSASGMMNISNILIPWNSIIFSILGVFVIVLLTMMYSSSKIKRQNIIEQIREENI